MSIYVTEIPGVMMLENSAADTAEFLLFIDKVFDSLNGSGVTTHSGKRLRVAVSKNPQHFDLWDEAIKIFSSIRLVNNKTGAKTTLPPTIQNWINDLKGFKY